MKKGKKIVIGLYIRVATDKQVDHGNSLEAQLEEGTVTAKKRFGEDIEIRVYIDEGMSGKNTINLNDLNRMLRDAKKGELTGLVSYNVPRLARNLYDSMKILEQLKTARVIFVSVKEGEYGTPQEYTGTFN